MDLLHSKPMLCLLGHCGRCYTHCFRLDLCYLYKVVCFVVHLKSTRWLSCLEEDFQIFGIKVFLNNLCSIGYIVYSSLHNNS